MPTGPQFQRGNLNPVFTGAYHSSSETQNFPAIRPSHSTGGMFLAEEEESSA